MQRSIVWFHQDARKDWVAHLDCGHRQHVRHRPPFQLRPWVEDRAGRASRLGSSIDCPLCDEGEVPEGLEASGTSPTWDQDTLPSALRREHRLAPSTWGVLRILSGEVRFAVSGDGAAPRSLRAGATRGIPPGVGHSLELAGPVRVAIDFYRVPAREVAAAGDAGRDDAGPAGVVEPEDEGGDPACWANLVCPDCGAVVGPGPHRTGCPADHSG